MIGAKGHCCESCSLNAGKNVGAKAPSSAAASSSSSSSSSAEPVQTFGLGGGKNKGAVGSCTTCRKGSK